jgi:hypothetical protein
MDEHAIQIENQSEISAGVPAFCGSGKATAALVDNDVHGDEDSMDGCFFGCSFRTPCMRRINRSTTD